MNKLLGNGGIGNNFVTYHQATEFSWSWKKNDIRVVGSVKFRYHPEEGGMMTRRICKSVCCCCCGGCMYERGKRVEGLFKAGTSCWTWGHQDKAPLLLKSRIAVESMIGRLSRQVVVLYVQEMFSWMLLTQTTSSACTSWRLVSGDLPACGREHGRSSASRRVFRTRLSCCKVMVCAPSSSLWDFS